ncbi:hypothetical protein AX16_003133 [Volvariella volvacea WC 439]|nr:hypothetical protein AX16_003133 [Volvariella volvacea WC 439]
MPASFLPILSCPLCDTPNSLTSPTTLHCGHSLCANHLHTYPNCPVSSCPASTPADLEVVPPVTTSSNVVILPPPASDDDSEDPSIPLIPPRPKVDVTLNKVISLVHRAQSWNSAQSSSHASTDDDDDSDDDTLLSVHSTRLPSPPPVPSRARPRSRSPSRSRSNSPSHDYPPGSPSRRPRKRQRICPPESSTADQPRVLTQLHPHSRHSRKRSLDPTDILARFKKELLAELTCEICFTLLFQPVTTPCQHTFCAKCLQRSQDHSQLCPLCRQPLPGYSFFQNHPYNKVILTIILKAFPSTYQERAEAIEAEERNAQLDTPIFVCLLSFPGIPTCLHFFEPRYRLMLRRCLESPTPSFGMIMSPKPGVANPEYGTMLEIRRVEMLRDGRSLVEAFGTYRFRIIERGILDGYTVGRIERVDDYPEDLPQIIYAPGPPVPSAPSRPSTPASVSSNPPSPSRTDRSKTRSSPVASPSPSDQPPLPTLSSIPPRLHATNEQLMQSCREFLDRLEQGAAPWVVQRLNNWYGPMPTDPAAFSFWVALVLPIEDQERAKLFPIRSIRLRLLVVSHWIEQLNNQWYAYPNIGPFFAWVSIRWVPLVLGIGLGLGLAQFLSFAGFTPTTAPLAVADSSPQQIALLAGLILFLWMFLMGLS